ncbi:hypothetical protein FQA39_LY08468 [Lamprigera yunnana]|nr:hypothetical protein FQA39_LY08468 [Lamprigera yunnana]
MIVTPELTCEKHHNEQSNIPLCQPIDRSPTTFANVNYALTFKKGFKGAFLKIHKGIVKPRGIRLRAASQVKPSRHLEIIITTFTLRRHLGIDEGLKIYVSGYVNGEKRKVETVREDQDKQKTIKFMHANFWRLRAVRDLLSTSMRAKDVDVAVISEPNKQTVDGEKWLVDKVLVEKPTSKD